ncbi:hypothetical protein NFIA_091160 [Paecilomyces variotii No. 5]|uniref:Sister chromatid cohesion protein Dcc1 n=1 Tax=Byssochlamys spectabilis (strain No. 5 / NBRC 109023) TaxID=1356009 RepID=V5FJ10_BYSSN|nr:hypothetical protein NFIA_091160 [Paecilomyces variotii No. 5]
MSTQAARSIRFTHTFPQQGFRLLELPPEVLELLSKEDAPVFHLKSPPSDLSQTTGEPAAREYVNLCSPTQTFRIRQVQSSNSIHILKPNDGSTQLNDNGIETGDLDLSETVTTIAKCGSTLELHVPPGGFSAVPFLEKALRVYDRLSWDGDVSIRGVGIEMTMAERRALKEKLFADIPVSTAQCQSGWDELCAFVHGDDAGNDRGVCWRPSARVKMAVWKRMLEGSVLQGIDIEKQFLAGDLWKAVLDDDEEEPFPRALFDAVLKRLVEAPGANDMEIKWANVDKAACTRWVGETYLQSSAPTASAAIVRTDFLNAWRDHLPESWRSEASLSALTNGSYRSTDPTTIYFIDYAEREKTKGSAVNGVGAATAKTSRNWHERFRNQRRQ